MRLTRLVPTGGADSTATTDRPAEIDTAAAEAREAIRILYAPPQRHWLRLNLIAGVDGGARGSDGTSSTLSNHADRAILGAIRSLADVVLIGAETLRAESYLVPRAARLAVVTTGGELSPTGTGSGTRTEPPRVLVLGPATAEERARATVTDAEVEFVALPGTGRVSMDAVVRALRCRGAASVVCEGGPRLAAQLLDAGLVDEICLSISPRLTGGELPVLAGARARELRLAGLLADDSGGLYARWLTEDR